MGYNDEPQIAEIDLNGFQLINANNFGRWCNPGITLWYNALAFNNAAFISLGQADSVQFYVNDERKSVIVMPCRSNEEESVALKKTPAKNGYARLECTLFTKKLFESWNFDKDCRYRVCGRQVQSGRKIMLIFDFTNPEVWKGSALVKENV